MALHKMTAFNYDDRQRQRTTTKSCDMCPWSLAVPASVLWSNKCRVITPGYSHRDLRNFVIRFDFESYVRFEIRFVLMVRFEIFESSAL